MKIIIAGDGKVGATLARQLSSEGYDLTLIDTKSSVLELSEERYDIMAVQGNCASLETLEKAGVMESDLLIAVTGADEINLLCCMTAHGANPKIHTIARIANPEYTAQIYKMRDIFALSMMVNPAKSAAVEVDRLLRYPGFLKRDTFAKGRVEIVELKIDEDSPLCDVTLMNLGNVVQCNVLVCSVLRDGKAITPSGSFKLQSGDNIFVTATVDNLTKLLKNLGIITHKAKKVFICGGGTVSYYLAQLLVQKGVMVKIVEQDYERCILLASLLPEVDIIHGDASDEFLLESEKVADYDAIVTLTGIDEMNTMISLYGHSQGIPQIITKVGRLENNTVLKSLPIGSIISPKALCSNAIVRYVRALKNQTGAARAVHYIADGQAEAMEFKADENTLHLGEPLKNIKLKKNVLIACISKGPKQFLPNGESFFEKGNTVIVVKSGDQVIYQLNDIFE